MTYEVLYDDWTVDSGGRWSGLPSIGIIIVWIIFPSGSRMQVSGWDYYVVREITNGLGVWMWKDENAVDINGNPIFDEFAGQYCYREFFDDNTGNDITYHPNSELPRFKKNEVKEGRWVDDATARQMGI